MATIGCTRTCTTPLRRWRSTFEVACTPRVPPSQAISSGPVAFERELATLCRMQVDSRLLSLGHETVTTTAALQARVQKLEEEVLRLKASK